LEQLLHGCTGAHIDALGLGVVDCGHDDEDPFSAHEKVSNG
jgi:hypothetical protein